MLIVQMRTDEAELLHQGSVTEQVNVCVPFAGNWPQLSIMFLVSRSECTKRLDDSSRNGCYDLHSA
jgi:hypothetical protein